MSKPAASRWERLAAGVSPEQKQIIEQAAELEGPSITDFIVAATQSAAKQVIQECELLKLGAQDREVLVQALMNPPKPNEKLRHAVRRYQGIVH